MLKTTADDMGVSMPEKPPVLSPQEIALIIEAKLPKRLIKYDSGGAGGKSVSKEDADKEEADP